MLRMKAVSLALGAALVLVWGALALAAGPSGTSGNSDTGHLYLYEMTAFPNGSILDGSGWGKMTYQFSEVGFDSNSHGKGNKDQNSVQFSTANSDTLNMIVFNGHNLIPGEEYMLVYMDNATMVSKPQGTWVELGSGTANGGGNLNIQMNSLNTGSLSNLMVWLVPATDFSNNTLTYTNQNDYLYNQTLLFPTN